MARGPLPVEGARRRNAPTIPTTNLPAGGFAGPIPKCPYSLAKAGRGWWRWAWRTPQAAAWDDGALYFVARRAQLEDEHTILGEFGEGFDELHELLRGADDEAVRSVEFALGTLKRLATNATNLKREMRELEERLGLTPKALAALRWKVVDDAAPAEPTRPARASNVRQLRPRDPAAAVG